MPLTVKWRKKTCAISRLSEREIAPEAPASVVSASVVLARKVIVVSGVAA